MITLYQATSCTPALIKAGMRELVDLYKPSYPYNKAGIMFAGLSKASIQQQHLFLSANDAENTRLMQSLDRINDRLGHSLLLAMITGCSTNKEQVYEGLYKGLGTAEQNQQIDNPSYDPVEAGQEQLGYQEYKRERDEGIKNN